MMMSLGGVVFHSETIVPQGLEQTLNYKWNNKQRVGRINSYQYTGVEEDVIKLTGIIYPITTHKPETLTQLKQMAEEKEPFYLINGEGYIYGDFVITSIKDRRSYFIENGAAQKIIFDLTLKKYEE